MRPGPQRGLKEDRDYADLITTGGLGPFRGRDASCNAHPECVAPSAQSTTFESTSRVVLALLRLAPYDRHLATQENRLLTRTGAPPLQQGRCSAPAPALAVLLCGGAARSSATPRQSSYRAPSTVINADDLTQGGQSGNLLDVLTRLRPGWFESRGVRTLASGGSSPPTALPILQAIQPIEVMHVRLERPTLSVGHAAVSANGSVIRNDIISVTTRVA